MEEFSLIKPILGTPLTALVPIRNGIDFLPGFKAQLSQILSHRDELLVIDDNSTDGTFEFLSEWAFIDNRVRVIRNLGDGLVDALNIGLKVAHNDWIARFDVDDEYSLQRLQMQREAIHESLAVVFSDYEFFGDGNPNLGRIYSAITPQATALSLISSQRTAHPSALFRKDFAVSAGGYLKEDFPAEDLSLWLRLLDLGTIETLPDPLLRYRISANSVTGKHRVSAKNKTKQLISSSEHLRLAYFESISALNSTVAVYKALDDGHFRFSLHVRDLLLATKMYGFRPNAFVRILIAINSFGGFRFASATLKIARSHQVRRNFRLKP